MIKFKERSYSSKLVCPVNKVIRKEPHKRTRHYYEDKKGASQNIDTYMDGIFVAFKEILDARNGHLDFITAKYAKEEIVELIKMCGGDPDKFKNQEEEEEGYNKQKRFEDFKVGEYVKYKGEIWTVMHLFPERSYVGLELDPFDLEPEKVEKYDGVTLFRDHWRTILENEN